MDVQQKERFRDLFYKYNNDFRKMTSEEFFEFDHLIKSKQANGVLKDLIDEFIAKEHNDISIDFHTPLLNKEEVYYRIAERINIDKPKRSIFNINHPIYKVAAILIFVLGFGAYFLIKQQNLGNKNVVAKNITQDVNPGGNHAILKIEGRKDIALDASIKGILSEIDQFSVSQNKKGEVIFSANVTSTIVKTYVSELITPRGGQYQLILSDGTHVWLNAASSITFPSQFSGNERRVSVKGEAYFEVAKNPDKPFYVSTSRSEIKVLGTHFNVMDYMNEYKSKTTLLEGSVKISNGSESKILKPNEQAIIDNNKNLHKIYLNNASKEVAWKDGYFEFKDDSLASVMRQLERWYDVDVLLDHNIKDGEYYNGKIPRNINLKEVMNILNYSGLNIKIEDKKVFVKH